MNTKDISLIGKKIKILVIGQQKTGKTRLIGTYPGLPYVFDFDDGMLTLRGKDIEFDTYVDDPKRPMAFINAIRQLEKFEASNRTSGKVVHNEREIQLIAVDSSTTMNDTILAHILFTKGQLDKSPTDFTFQGEFGPMKQMYITFVRRLLALPTSLLLICHEAAEKNELTQMTQVLPDLVGKLSSSIGVYFDFVFRCESRPVGGKTEYALLTQNQGLYTAGTRLSDVLELKEVPDLRHIIEKAQSKLEGDAK